jgi:hypothetical protein
MNARLRPRWLTRAVTVRATYLRGLCQVTYTAFIRADFTVAQANGLRQGERYWYCAVDTPWSEFRLQAAVASEALASERISVW